MDAEVVVVGAGPHGLAVAAFLRSVGVEARVFGDVMGFWERHMPRGMLLRSSKRSSHIADPERASRIDDFERSEGTTLPEPVPLARYLEYARWYQRRVAPEVDPRRIESIEPAAGGYAVRTSDGETLRARRVVVGAGISCFAWRPPEFDALPAELASHSLDHADFARFRDRRVLVVGGGQSALESAALLHEAGAEVDVVVRAPSVVWIAEPRSSPSAVRRLVRTLSYPPTDLGSRGLSWIAAAPDVFRRLPWRVRSTVSEDCTRPMGAFWLPARMTNVAISTGSRIASVQQAAGKLKVVLDDGSRREVDHLLLATGYRVDIARYPFLSERLLQAIRTVRGYPVLGDGLESSARGLHFVGAPAALSFGPVMRFVVGSWYAAPAVARRVIGKPPRPLAFAF